MKFNPGQIVICINPYIKLLTKNKKYVVLYSDDFNCSVTDDYGSSRHFSLDRFSDCSISFLDNFIN